jgi:hypothetical protein
VSSNSAIGASGWEYTQTGVTASNYTLSGNIHLWNTAASGTDGGAVTFTERMRLNTTGLGIGTNNPSAKLDVVGNAEINGNLNVTGTVTATAFIGESPSVFSIRDEKSVNVAAQYLPANTWTHHNLQTTDVNTLTGASLAANVITLPAGTFDVYASTQSYRGNGSKARLYDITNSATLLASTSNASHSSFYSGVTEQIIGRITVASGGITCRLEQNVTTASYAGINVNKTEPEIYSYVKFTEVT